MKFKKLLSLLTAFLMLSGSVFCASAVSPVKEINQLYVAADPTYISQEDAVLLADQHICLRHDVSECPWTSNTKISDTVSLFDPEGNVNAYLFRLETDNEPSGYILVNAYSESPGVSEFSYEGESTLDTMLKYNNKEIAKTEDEIVYMGSYSFLEKVSGSGENSEYVNISTNNVVDAKKSELSVEYKNHYAKSKDLKQKNNFSQVKAFNNKKMSGSQTSVNNFELPVLLSQVVYDSGSVPNLWGSTNFTPYVMSSFPTFDNTHAVVTSLNMIKYWNERRNIGKLYVNTTQQTFHEIRNSMFFYATQIYGVGAFDLIAFQGMHRYLYVNARTYQKGSDFRDKYIPNAGFTWSYIKTQVKNGNVFCVDTRAITGNKHCVLGLGYEETSTGDYIRIADGWHNNISYFLKYTWTYEDAVWYLRWA